MTSVRMDSAQLETLARLTAAHHRRAQEDVERARRSDHIAAVVLAMIACVGLFFAVSLPPATLDATGRKVLGTIAVGCLLLAAYSLHHAARAAPRARVTRVAKVDLRFARLPFDSRSSVLLERSGVWPTQRLTYPRLRDPERLRRAHTAWVAASQRLPELLRETTKVTHHWGDIAELPPTGQTIDLYDNEGALVSATLEMAEALADVDAREVEVAALGPDSETATFLLARQADSTVASVRPLASDADETRLVADLAGAVAGPETRQGADDLAIEDWLRAAHANLVHRAQVIAAHRHSAIDRDLRGFVAEYSDLSHFSAFEFFCRRCNAEHLTSLARRRFLHGEESGHAAPDLNRSAVMRYLPSRRTWKCILCRFEDAQPLALPRMLTEAFLPSFQRLLEEHHVERLTIYNDIANQKRSYANDGDRELAALRESHGQESRALRSRLGEIKATQEAARIRVASFGSLLAQQQLLETQRLREIEAATQEVEKRIKAAFAEFEQRYDRRMAGIQQQAVSDMTRFAELARAEEAAKMAVMQQIAANTELTAHSTAETAHYARETAVVQRAFAHRAGLDKPASWNLAGQLSYGLGNLRQALSGQSSLERFRKEV